MKKKILAVILAMSMAGALFAGCGGTADEGTGSNDKQSEQTSEKDTQQDDTEEGGNEEAVTIRVGGLSGPTSMGLVKLMEDSANGETENTYEFADLAADATAFVSPLATGEIDIAAVPSNLASVVYNNTEGGVQVLAVNTLGVLNIVESGEEISSIADLAGKTIYATGQGATPEYTLRYLLSQNGVDPDNDITIQWCSDTTEILSYVSADASAIAMIPQPFATVALTQVEGLRIALDLNDEWAKLDTGCDIVTGVLVVRTEFAEQYPQQLATFMEEYEASVNYTAEEAESASELIEKYIGVKAAVAAKALPNCHITFLAGTDMKASLEGYLQVLYDQSASSIGGSMPGEDFYYGL